MAQPNGNNGPEKDSVENSGISKGTIEELKDSTKKIAGGSDIVTKLKPSRNDLFKVLALIVGFVVGVYCTKSWIA